MDDSLNARRRRGGFPLMLAISMLLLLGASALLVYELVAFSRREEQLPGGITVAGINVSHLGAREAVARWERTFAEPITMIYRDETGDNLIQMHPDQVGWRISSEPMLAAVLASGEEEGGFWRRFLDFLFGIEQIVARDIPLIADYQENSLEAFLLDVALRYDQPPGKPSFDPQSLTVSPGTRGHALDVSASLPAVNIALRSADSRSLVLTVGPAGNDGPSLDSLRAAIIDYLDSQGFIYDGQRTVASVYVLDLTTGDEISILGDVAFSAASTVKVPIMLEYLRALPVAPSAEEAWLLANSLLCSNNSSSNLLMEIIGGGDVFAGLRRVTDTIRAVGIGNTFITAPFYLGVEGQELGSIQIPTTSPNPDFDTRPDPFNQTTAEDLGALFGLIYDCAEFASGLALALPEGQITPQECRQILELSSANDLERLLQGGIPPGTRISHKNGWIFDTVGDAGIVYSPNGRHYVISVFLWEETEFQDYEKLWPLVEEISRATWNYFNAENAVLQARSDLPPTAVECEGNYLPPGPEFVDLNDINSWRRN